MCDSPSLPSDSESTSENLQSTESEPVKKPPKRKVARKRPTHVRLQNSSLLTISSLDSRKDALVLYLYNNKIERLTNLDALTKLTHLYLSHNSIRRMENLGKMVSLEKLYIGHNKISVLEGLEGLRRLRELHLQSQRLPAGDMLTFDLRSIQAVRGTLHVLNIDNNGVTSLKALTPLSYLTDLCCADNQLSSLVELSQSLRQLPCLSRLDLKGNPVCQLRRHRDTVVESAAHLTRLDDLDVTTSLRQFIAGRGRAAALRQSAVQQPPVTSSSTSDDVILRDLSEAGGLHGPRPALSQASLPHRRPGSTACQPRQTSSTHLRVGNMLTLTPHRSTVVRTAAGRRVQSEGQLKTPGGDLGRLETPGGDLGRLETPGGDLGRLETPGGDLGRLETPDGDLWRLETPGGDLGRLKTPGGDLGRLKTPGGDLGRWETPGGDLWQRGVWSRKQDTLPSSPARRPAGAVGRPLQPGWSRSYTQTRAVDLSRSAGRSARREVAPGGGPGTTPLRQTVSDEVTSRLNMLAIMP